LGELAPSLAVRDGEAAGDEGLARVGALDVGAEGGVLGVLAEARLLRTQVATAPVARLRAGGDRGHAHRQLPHLARRERPAGRRHQQRQHHGRQQDLLPHRHGRRRTYVGLL
uniref:Uncharacterized protein n=1 Tax=Triticum urartu TaxID=4572 RepID=A0A8R7QIR9_TRIUA